MDNQHDWSDPDEGPDINRSGSPTPVRRGARKVPPSPSGSPRRGGRMAYGDRFIPNRTGINLQAAFSLANDDASIASRASQNAPYERDFQRVEEANRTFSTVLKAELFGDDVPSAVPGPSSATSSSGTSVISPSNSNRSISSTPYDSNQSPPQSSRSAPATPRKNMFQYQSPSRQGLAAPPGSVPADVTGLARDFSVDSQNEIYSLSPVRMDLQKILLSPRKQPRPVSKVPYKVLDAPELADDFYLNLVDWGSANVLGVGLGSSIYLWNANSGEVDQLCKLDNDERVTSVSWIKRGTHLAVGTSSGLVQIWDAESRKRLRQMSGHTARAGSLSWYDHILTSGSQDRTILHRDVRVPDHYIKRLVGHRQEVCGLKWNTDEGQLASGGNDNKLVIWNGLDTEPLYKFSDHEAAVKAISWSPHQRGLLASGGGTKDRRIRFWNTLTGTPLGEIDTGSQVCNLAWSQNSKELVSTHGYSQNQIVIWKYPSMQQVAALTGHTYRVLYLATSPDGRSIVTGAGDETLRFWNIFDDTKTGSRGSSSLLDLFQQLR